MNSAKQKSKIAFNQQAPTYDCDIKGQHARTLYPVIINRLKSISYQTALDLGVRNRGILTGIHSLIFYIAML